MSDILIWPLTSRTTKNVEEEECKQGEKGLLESVLGRRMTSLHCEASRPCRMGSKKKFSHLQIKRGQKLILHLLVGESSDQFTCATKVLEPNVIKGVAYRVSVGLTYTSYQRMYTIQGCCSSVKFNTRGHSRSQHGTDNESPENKELKIGREGEAILGLAIDIALVIIKENIPTVTMEETNTNLAHGDISCETGKVGVCGVDYEGPLFRWEGFIKSASDLLTETHDLLGCIIRWDFCAAAIGDLFAVPNSPRVKTIRHTKGEGKVPIVGDRVPIRSDGKFMAEYHPALEAKLKMQASEAVASVEVLEMEFYSVMRDGSPLPLEANMSSTQSMSSLTYSRMISVEAVRFLLTEITPYFDCTLWLFPPPVRAFNFNQWVKLQTSKEAKCSGINRVGILEDPDRSALVDAWKSWMEEHIAETGNVPPGNESGNSTWVRQPAKAKPDLRLTPGHGKQLTVPLEELIDKLVKEIEVVVFIKGSRNAPQCGFSQRVLGILNSHGVDYESVNVLDEEYNFGLREALKQYSNWPTFPQIFVRGELIGGADILASMEEKGELASLFNK
ncbi:Bifunctional monothiol glutaredoxin-S16 [Nymphaea thermarum]|nr:Bifunctional monothiol glutaredoxin-S16 [Nymphaea thermarum]